MRDINEIRSDIDKIDEELRNSFIKRMNLVKEMKEYKRINNLNTFDKLREEEIINKIDKNIEYEEEVITFTKYLLLLSKTYMNK